MMHQQVLKDIEQLMEPATTYDEGEQPLEQQALWLLDFYLEVCILGSNPPVLYWSLVFYDIDFFIKIVSFKSTTQLKSCACIFHKLVVSKLCKDGMISDGWLYPTSDYLYIFEINQFW